MSFVGTRLALTAALAGAATMIVELAAVRLVAPYFGASLVVWTNVIGVVLGALAVGYVLGSRLARRDRPTAALGWVLALAAITAALAPAGAEHVCRTFLPDGLALHEASGLIAWGSLAATAVLFGPVAVGLGAASPLIVEAWQRESGVSAGVVGGRALGLSTLGGLAGAFATPHVLVPGFGLHATYWTAALLLVLGSALGACSSERRSSRNSGLGARSLLLALALGSGFVAFAERAPRDGRVELARAESPYQRVRVVEDRSGSEPMRLLQVNEGLDSFQSVWVPRTGLIGEGYYYDAFALPAWWSAPTDRWRLGVLGLGAGTAFRVLEGALPPGTRLEAFGVEIDPVVVDFGKRWFQLVEDDRHRVLSGLDARCALRTNPGPFDELVLDAYANQVEIPAHLCSVEFFREVWATLAPRGWFVINVGGFGCDDPVVVAIAETVAATFDSGALAVRIPASRNVVLFARREAELVRPNAPAWGEERPGWRIAALDGYGLLSKTTHPTNSRYFEARSDAPLTDDVNPIDRLQRESLELGREHAAALD
ncbi:MAG: fused MFS/spermidine synthase [Planctomycetes bacterium]|nr:fused MFS/spermidine synthase [Planctomycetota bacterium]